MVRAAVIEKHVPIHCGGAAFQLSAMPKKFIHFTICVIIADSVPPSPLATIVPICSFIAVGLVGFGDCVVVSSVLSLVLIIVSTPSPSTIGIVVVVLQLLE